MHLTCFVSFQGQSLAPSIASTPDRPVFWGAILLLLDHLLSAGVYYSWTCFERSRERVRSITPLDRVQNQLPKWCSDYLFAVIKNSIDYPRKIPDSSRLYQTAILNWTGRCWTFSIHHVTNAFSWFLTLSSSLEWICSTNSTMMKDPLMFTMPHYTVGSIQLVIYSNLISFELRCRNQCTRHWGCVQEYIGSVSDDDAGPQEHSFWGWWDISTGTEMTFVYHIPIQNCWSWQKYTMAIMISVTWSAKENIPPLSKTLDTKRGNRWL